MYRIRKNLSFYYTPFDKKVNLNKKCCAHKRNRCRITWQRFLCLVRFTCGGLLSKQKSSLHNTTELVSVHFFFFYELLCHRNQLIHVL